MSFIYLKAFVFCLSCCVVQCQPRRKPTALVNDPKFKDQWYLGQLNSDYPGRHNNIISAWKQGATGKGVLIAVLDNGVQLDHPDLKRNIEVRYCHNYLNPKEPAYPTTLFDKFRDGNPTNLRKLNTHGTHMAGIIGMAANNKKCGIGVAFNAKIAAVKILGPVMNVSQHAAAHSHLSNKVHVYSESYGPYDNGKIISRYQPMTMNAIIAGVQKGRNGLGSIYVKPSGNGRPNGDHCGADGTVNTIYNIAVAAAARDHKTPYYTEECASILTAVYTQHTKLFMKGYHKDIVTTGINGSCIDTNGGSSTAAAITSGIIALALSVNKKLTWRDVQYLIVASSKRNGLPGNWTRNGAGLQVSHMYGYGILNAGRMVQMAKSWRAVSKAGTCYTPYLVRMRKFKVEATPKKILYHYFIRGCTTVDLVEQVSVVTTTKFSRRGDISIYLTSPKMTTSLLLGRRINDNSRRPFWRWKFTSVHYWGESVNGDWKITFEYSGIGSGYIRNTYLVFYGTRRRYTPLRRMYSRNRARQYGQQYGDYGQQYGQQYGRRNQQYG